MVRTVARDESDATAGDLTDHRRRRWLAERRVDVDGPGRLQEAVEARPAEDTDLRVGHERCFFPAGDDPVDPEPPEPPGSDEDGSELDDAGFSAGFDSFVSFFSLLESEVSVDAAGFSLDFSPDFSPDLSEDVFDFFP
jgi:hypothetical protein